MIKVKVKMLHPLCAKTVDTATWLQVRREIAVLLEIQMDLVSTLIVQSLLDGGLPAVPSW
jgi:hypothetical protein